MNKTVIRFFLTNCEAVLLVLRQNENLVIQSLTFPLSQLSNIVIVVINCQLTQALSSYCGTHFLRFYFLIHFIRQHADAATIIKLLMWNARYTYQ